jgi:hypothetical protein
MAALNSRLETLEREGAETSILDELTPNTRALLDAMRDPSVPTPEAPVGVSVTVSLPRRIPGTW